MWELFYSRTCIHRNTCTLTHFHTHTSDTDYRTQIRYFSVNWNKRRKIAGKIYIGSNKSPKTIKTTLWWMKPECAPFRLIKLMCTVQNIYKSVAFFPSRDLLLFLFLDALVHSLLIAYSSKRSRFVWIFEAKIKILHGELLLPNFISMYNYYVSNGMLFI